jgi:hypothetical protein
LATNTDKTTENEVFWAHKKPRRFEEENLERVCTRKEEEGTTIKGEGFRISWTNNK